MGSVPAALQRLREAAADGGLQRLCAEHGVGLVVVFGSALQDVRAARDLDVAVGFDGYRPDAVLPLLAALTTLTGTDSLDLLVLDSAGPVAREQALVFGEPLAESATGRFAEAQIDAIMQRLDTDHLRRVELELLAQEPR